MRTQGLLPMISPVTLPRTQSLVLAPSVCCCKLVRVGHTLEVSTLGDLLLALACEVPFLIKVSTGETIEGWIRAIFGLLEVVAVFDGVLVVGLEHLKQLVSFLRIVLRELVLGSGPLDIQFGDDVVLLNRTNVADEQALYPVGRHRPADNLTHAYNTTRSIKCWHVQRIEAIRKVLRPWAICLKERTPTRDWGPPNGPLGLYVAPPFLGVAEG